MTSPRVDGARLQGALGASGALDPAEQRLLGSLANAKDPAAFAQALASQLQEQMFSSLDGLTADGEDGGAEGGGEGDDSMAQLQALMGAGFGAGLVQAGAGGEAAAAQALLGELGGAGGIDGTSGIDGASGASTDPAAGAVDAGAVSNAKVVAAEAKRRGVDPVTAVAMMLVESGGRNTAVGDGGTSFGLFQLHQGGMLTAAGLTPEQAMDPATNAGVALASLRSEWDKGHASRTPGQIAAASQRPADPAGYARRVDGMLDRARALLASAGVS